MKTRRVSWDDIQLDRDDGMTIAEVCTKYKVAPATIRRARREGLLNDKRKLNTREAAEQRKRKLESLSNTEVQHLYDKCGGVATMLRELNLVSSKHNRNALLAKLAAAGIDYKNNRSNKYTIDEFKLACLESRNYNELTKLLGLSYHTANNRTFDKLITEHNIDTSHWRQGTNRQKYGYDEIFCRDSPIPRTTIRSKIIEYGVLNLDVCSSCMLSTWLNQPIVVQVDHIDGNPSNNELSNLRALCPNCHSLTDTFCGKKR